MNATNDHGTRSGAGPNKRPRQSDHCSSTNDSDAASCLCANSEDRQRSGETDGTGNASLPTGAVIASCDHLSRLNPELLLMVMEYLVPMTLPETLALASMNRSLRNFIYKDCGKILWKDLIFHDQYNKRPVLIPSVLEGRFTDDDLHRLLENINAKEVTRCIQIKICESMNGEGLTPIAGSSVLEKLVVRFWGVRKKGLSQFVQLLCSFFVPMTGDSIYPNGGYSLKRVDVEVWNLWSAKNHKNHKALVLAMDTLHSRMKRYWVPSTVSCSHCEGQIENVGLSADNVEEEWDIMSVAAIPNWLCVLCSRATCRQGSCPKVRFCAADFPFKQCILPGPFCAECEQEFKKCESCNEDVCLMCAGHAKCKDCGSLHCGKDFDVTGDGDCELNECEECGGYFCFENCGFTGCESYCVSRACKSCSAGKVCSDCGNDVRE